MKKVDLNNIIGLDSGPSNYYGGIKIMEHNSKYYWLIENWDTDFEDISYWGEIREELYNLLLRYK